MIYARRSPATQPVSRHAFTLIELLVVIAIIAILAAILFPVFAQAREKARQTSCLNNMKQIGISILTYNQDFDDAFPMAFYTTSASQTPLSWPVLVQPYLKNTAILLCPDQTATIGPVPGTFTAAYPNGIATNYLLNFYMSGNGGGTAIANVPQIKSPASTVLIVDGGSNPQSNVNQTATQPTTWKEDIGGATAGPNTITVPHSRWLLLHAGSVTMPDNTYCDYGGPLPRHSQMTNVLWADGHAKSSRVETFYTMFGTEVPSKPVLTPALSAAWSPCLDPNYGCNYLN